MEQKLRKRNLEFDPDYSHLNTVNIQAAKQRGLEYSPKNQSYVDEDGCLIRDEFGQEF